MLSALASMGLEAAWLPLFVALVGLPGLYISLAMEAFKDYSELIKGAASLVPRAEIGTVGSTAPVGAGNQAESHLALIREELKIFELDWWVVAALGVLLFAMICAANLVDLPSPSPTPFESSGKPCSGPAQPNVVKAWMSLYATGFGLLVGFRLIWARLTIARGIRTYHEACHMPSVGSGK